METCYRFTDGALHIADSEEKSIKTRVTTLSPVEPGSACALLRRATSPAHTVRDARVPQELGQHEAVDVQCLSSLSVRPVKPSTCRGLENTVIERAIVNGLQAEAGLGLPAKGLQARPAIPARNDEPVSAEEHPPAINGGKHRGMSGKMPSDVLIVEDSLIIALDMAEIIRGFGTNTVRTAMNLSEGLRLIDEAVPDFALLDINLGDTTSFDIAKKLVELSVPLAFTTGYGDQAVLPDIFSTVPRLAKPFSPEMLGNLLLSETGTKEG